MTLKLINKVFYSNNGKNILLLSLSNLKKDEFANLSKSFKVIFFIISIFILKIIHQNFTYQNQIKSNQNQIDCLQ
jgi:hypothetical protein